MSLSFEHFSLVNRARSAAWHDDGEPWTGADWANAMQGEAGEAGNVVKKLRRLETHTYTSPDDPQEPELLDKLGDEIADTIIYADLLADHYGVNVEAALIRKFNRKSREIGLPFLLPEGEREAGWSAPASEQRPLRHPFRDPPQALIRRAEEALKRQRERHEP